MHNRRDSASPSADEVRDIVRRIVDATLTTGEPAASTGQPAVSAGEASGASPAAAAAEQPAVRAERVTIAIGADHGGVALKDRIAEVLRKGGYSVTDCGTHGSDPVDYPDIAYAVARLVADGACNWGIILDGAGIGSCMAANKVPGIRAALCHDVSSARNSREHNHANVLTLGARFVGEGLAVEIVQTWLGTVWGYGRHAARVEKITAIERKYTAVASEVRG